MSKIEKSLKSISIDNNKTINGTKVDYDGKWYIIDGQGYSLSDAVTQIVRRSSTTGLDYDSTAFLIFNSNKELVSQHRIRNKSEHRALLELAKSNNNYLYYSAIIKRDQKFYVQEPYIVDFDSVPDSAYSQKELNKTRDTLVCPYCNKKVNSLPGRTLHVKSKHPNKLEEYHNVYNR